MTDIAVGNINSLVFLNAFVICDVDTQRFVVRCFVLFILCAMNGLQVFSHHVDMSMLLFLFNLFACVHVV